MAVDRSAPAAPLPWKQAWFRSATPLAMTAWRAVESQTDIATTKLVDTAEERDALEDMLEASTPPLPPAGQGLHYLLVTPFRYTSTRDSRFRASDAPGVWYGADSPETACAEVAYWRHRFILDSAGLARSDDEIITTHTLFRAGVDGLGIDLTASPWRAASAVWTHPQSYVGTQALARQARHRGIDWIRYSSVRNPGAVCAAVLDACALSKTRPSSYQAWICRATRRQVWFSSRDAKQTFSWDF